MKYVPFDHFFMILSNKQRVRTLQLLASDGPQSVSAIAEALHAEQSTVSHGLSQLLECHFVTVNKQGKERIYAVNEDTVKPLLDQIDRHVRAYCAKNCQH